MKKNLLLLLVAAMYLIGSVAGISQAHANAQTATLVNTTELFNWTVPSPDPAGVVFIPGADSLFLTDSEVNETGLFTGSNMFQAGIDGSLYETFSTIDFTSEPTGITVNPANGHLFISEDDSPRRIYEIDPGPDGIYRNSDDSITSFSTTAFGSWDAEGLTFNPADGRLYIAGGAIDLVYIVDPGANQLFDGISPAGDDTVTSFDVSQLGITDPEGIAYDSLTDALYVVGKPVDTLLHVSTSGELLRLITLDSPLLKRPAGLGIGPSSLDNGAESIYLVDRGDDNDYDPLENDGRLFEFSLPPLPDNQAPVVTITAPTQGESFAANSAVTFIGAADDAEEGDLSGSLVWSSDRDGMIGTGSQFDISTLSVGQHTITASCVDSFQGTGLSMLSVLVYPQGTFVLETRIDSSSDDAEQRGLNGNTWIDGNDLELIKDNSVEQIVGLRFNTLQIPANATIEEAYIRFQADEVQTAAVTLEIRAQQSDSAEPILGRTNNLTNRPTTNSSSIWQPAPWTTVGESGLAQKTSDLASLVQEVVNRPGWTPGNSMLFLISGSGPDRRTAESYDSEPDGAPLLYVRFTETPSAPMLLISSPTTGDTFSQGSPVTFAGTADDIQDGDLSDSISWTSDIDGLLGAGSTLTLTSLSTGTHQISATVTDGGGLSTTEMVSISIGAPVNTAPIVTLTSPADGLQTSSGTPVTFSATASDNEDGDLSASVNWVSDQDGVLGTGSSITVSNLTIGAHQITASVIDSGDLTSSDSVSITIDPPTNSEPEIAITSPVDGSQTDTNSLVTLTATATDAEDGDLSASVNWLSDIDGDLGIGSPAVLLTAGLHTITASVSDSGNLTVSASVMVEVEFPQNSDVTEMARVSSSSDDAEERDDTGRMALNSSDLELVMDKNRPQVVGIRFNELQIPKDAGIVSASIQFKVDETDSDFTVLTISVEKSDDPVTFTSNAFDITARPRSIQSVQWLPSPWNSVGSAGADQQTPDLSELVQQIVTRENWVPGNSMVFLFEGDGTRTAEAFDGDANGAPLLTVTYTQSNSAPSVSASADQPVVQLTDTAYVSATADDDGLPVDPGFLTHQWSVGNGPGGVTFGDPDSPSTSANFNAVGTYQLIHTVSDGQLSGHDTVTVTVEPTPQNQAPVVMAGDDQVIDIGEAMVLNGFVGDDGLPDSGVPLIIDWTQVSGPGTAVVEDADNVSTAISYSEPGVYTFELSAYDGELISTDEVVVTVVDFVTSNSVTIPIINGNDDMEEFADGGPDLVSSDLEMTFDKSNQIVGMRFQAVPVPNGAIITAAHVQFTVDEVDSAATDLIIQAEITDNSAPFADEMRNLSSRSLTLASVPWSPPAWTVKGQSGAAQQTPDLAGVIQEIVDQPGWTNGNALSILVLGNGVRTAESFDGEADAAARLVIEYQ